MLTASENIWKRYSRGKSLYRWNIKENKRNRQISECFYYIYILSGIADIIAGFQGDFYGVYYLWFLLCIPLINGDDSSCVKKPISYITKPKKAYYFRADGC